ncbi:MAG: oligopeptide/dipeptide ABC transporter ATP-binding protein [Ilumatobacteraceae bacterium]
MTASSKTPLLATTGICRTFGSGANSVTALDDVSFHVDPGETVVLVGESGSGKTTAARIVLGLDQPGAGTVEIKGTDTSTLSRRRWRDVRRSVQVVLQDPSSQLNRRHSVQRIVSGPLLAYGIGDKRSRRARVIELLGAVGLEESHLKRRPSELSGGQCQRVAIARALALEPDLVVLDESVSALDVSVQAQVLNLLKELQASHDLSYLLITHDLAVARYMAHRTYVMFQGRVVESGPTAAVLSDPQHPYTVNLLKSIVPDQAPTDADVRAARPDTAEIELDDNDGCRYLARCAASESPELCRSERPALAGADGHLAACHFPTWQRVTMSQPHTDPDPHIDPQIDPETETP